MTKPPKVKVTVDRAALIRHLRTDDEALAALRFQAVLLKIETDKNAAQIRNTGHHFTRTYVRKFRHYYQVVQGDTFSFIIEYGSKNNPAYRPLTRAARTVFGDRFDETGKADQ